MGSDQRAHTLGGEAFLAFRMAKLTEMGPYRVGVGKLVEHPLQCRDLVVLRLHVHQECHAGLRRQLEQEAPVRPVDRYVDVALGLARWHWAIDR